jgi:hypothetical protein
MTQKLEDPVRAVLQAEWRNVALKIIEFLKRLLPIRCKHCRWIGLRWMCIMGHDWDGVKDSPWYFEICCPRCMKEIKRWVDSDL